MRFAEVVKREKLEEKTVCDICGKETPYRDDEGENDWVYMSKMEGWLGASWPEGDFTNHLAFDVCCKCFIKSVVPLIKKELNIPIVEWDAENYEEDVLGYKREYDSDKMEYYYVEKVS